MTTPAMHPILSLQDVRFTWPDARAFGLQVPRFDIEAGERVLLLGESGSGKSTLLSLICGTLAAHSGQVNVSGTDHASLSAKARDQFRAEHIGLIFQQFNLLPYASVLDNILLPLRFAPRRRSRVQGPQDTARRLCRMLGLPANVANTKAGQLSVGQQQRVAAARALIGAPPIIIADEPTSALDAATQSTFLDLLFAQAKESNSTVLMVSHDARLASYFDRTVEMPDICTAIGQAA